VVLEVGVRQVCKCEGQDFVVFMRTWRKVWSSRLVDLENAGGGWYWNQGLGF